MAQMSVDLGDLQAAVTQKPAASLRRNALLQQVCGDAVPELLQSDCGA